MRRSFCASSRRKCVRVDLLVGFSPLRHMGAHTVFNRPVSGEGDAIRAYRSRALCVSCEGQLQDDAEHSGKDGYTRVASQFQFVHLTYTLRQDDEYATTLERLEAELAKASEREMNVRIEAKAQRLELEVRVVVGLAVAEVRYARHAH